MHLLVLPKSLGLIIVDGEGTRADTTETQIFRERMQ